MCFFLFVWFPRLPVVLHFLLLRNLLRWLLVLVSLDGVTSTLFSGFKFRLWHSFVITVCLNYVRMPLCHFQFHVLTLLNQQVFVVRFKKLLCCVYWVLHFYNEKTCLTKYRVTYVMLIILLRDSTSVQYPYFQIILKNKVKIKLGLCLSKHHSVMTHVKSNSVSCMFSLSHCWRTVQELHNRADLPPVKTNVRCILPNKREVNEFAGLSGVNMQ